MIASASRRAWVQFVDVRSLNSVTLFSVFCHPGCEGGLGGFRAADGRFLLAEVARAVRATAQREVRASLEQAVEDGPASEEKEWRTFHAEQTASVVLDPADQDE
jgi:hypothetical protein